MIKKLLTTLLLVVLPFTPAFAVSTSTIFDTDTKLMLHTNGADASTTFTDSSTTANTVTAVGNAQIDTAQSKFGGASGLFDGTGDYLTVPDSANWAFGSGAFTIDFWVRFNTVPAGFTALVTQFDAFNTDRSWQIGHTGSTNTFSFAVSNTGSSTADAISASWSPSTATWYHIAIIRTGDSLKAFIDGTQVGSTYTLSAAYSLKDSAGLLVVGAQQSSGGSNTYQFFHDGWIEELRIVKGTAVWTSNFTPPSAEYVSPARRRIITVS